MTRVSGLLPLGIFLSTLGLVLHIIGMATPAWVTAEILHQKLDLGIFKNCLGDVCVSIENISDSQRTVQAMTVLACLAGGLAIAIATVYTVLCIADKYPRKIFRFIAFMVCVIAKAFVVAGLVIFRSKVYEEIKEKNAKDMSLGYSFALSSLGGVGILVGGILIVVARGYAQERYTS